MSAKKTTAAGVLAIAAAGVLAIATARPATACSCLEMTLKELVSKAAMVFVGKPISHTKRPINPAECAKPQPNRCRYAYTHEVQVEGVWKGDVPSVVTIESGAGGGDCTFGKLAEERYLFVTSPKLGVSTCGGTQRASKAVLDEMNKRFGAPKPPKTARP